MFIAQLAGFLAMHHHMHWAYLIFHCSAVRFDHILTWALHHGFVYHV